MTRCRRHTNPVLTQYFLSSILNEIVLPLANYPRHPLMLDRLKDHIVLFKPEVRTFLITSSSTLLYVQLLNDISVKVYPWIYVWSTTVLTDIISRIHTTERTKMINDQPLNPLNVELCAILERALNFMHMGNLKVLVNKVMSPLWIGDALVQDGLPCLNPNVIRFYGSSSWEVLGQHWPWDPLSGVPMSAAFRVMVFNFGANIANVSPLHYMSELSPAFQQRSNGGV
jgi:hypothetical protein